MYDEENISLIRGDAIEKYYTFLDTSGCPLTNEIVEKAEFSIGLLKFSQDLTYDEECREWRLYIPSRVTKKFKPFVGRYNITLTLCDENNVTVIYDGRIQVFKKNIVGE